MTKYPKIDPIREDRDYRRGNLVALLILLGIMILCGVFSG